MKSNLLQTSIAALLLCALGCAHGPSSERPARGQQTTDASNTEEADSNGAWSMGLFGVAFDPPDLSTNLGTKPIRILCEGAGEAHLLKLAKFVSLQTLDGTPVAFDAKPVPYTGSAAVNCPKKTCPEAASPDAEADSEPDKSYLEVVPKQPLGDEWYVVSLHNLPANYFVANVPIDQAPAPLFGAQYSIRVHPSSNPQVRNLVISGDLDKDLVGATLHLSEPVRVSDMVSAFVFQVGETKCTPYNMSEWPEDVFAQYIDWFAVVCNTEPDTDKSKWHFSMKAGAKSASSKPLRVFPDHETWTQDLVVESVKAGKWPTEMGAVIQW